MHFPLVLLCAAYSLQLGACAAKSPTLPLQPGSYAGSGVACHGGMSYWSNRMGAGLMVGDLNSPIYGDNCVFQGVRGIQGAFDVAATCQQGHAPERMRHFQIRTTNPHEFIYRGNLYAWCAP